jgi:hypothetical protein
LTPPTPSDLLDAVFGWLSKRRVACPISEESREWVERRSAWIVEQFGRERVLSCPVVLPTGEFFPRRYEESPEGALDLFDRVRSFLGVADGRAELYLVEGRAEQTTNYLVHSDGPSALGTYQATDEGPAIICLTVDLLPYPTEVVSTVAHELCHVLLLGDGLVSAEEDDHEPLTDLLMVFLGFGVFGANTVVRERVERMDLGSAWSIGSSGYLSEPTWAFALALFASMRGEPAPPWQSSLRPSVAAGFRRSSRYLSERAEGA